MTLLRTQRASRMRSLHVIRERKRDLTRALSRTLIRSCVYYWDNNKEKEKYVESKSPIKLPIYKFLDSTWNDIITSTRQPRDMNRLILCRDRKEVFFLFFRALQPCNCVWMGSTSAPEGIVWIVNRRRLVHKITSSRESKNGTQQNARVKYSTLWDKISTAKKSKS